VIHSLVLPGHTFEVKLAAKGVGSENKAKFVMLNPSDSIAKWVLEVVPTMGAGWCPPGMLGIGIGGSAEKAMLLAKESLLDPIDMHELKARGPKSRIDELRLEIFDYPTHAASLPVAIIPNCAATRHAHFVMDGTGPVSLPVPSPAVWPDVHWTPAPSARRVNLDTVTRDEVRGWKPGETLLLSGKMLTGRDAAHKRIADLFASGSGLPAGVDFTNRFIYYVGPVDPVREEVVGPAGPTTATRMDKFTGMMLDKTGLLGMIGKAERGPIGIEAIKKHGAVYLMAVGGAAYLVSKAIRSSRLVAFGDLGMEAIYEFEVEHMPVTVAVDAAGHSVHSTGPAEWRQRIVSLKTIDP
jgi:fumarate hydratase class I